MAYDINKNQFYIARKTAVFYPIKYERIPSGKNPKDFLVCLC